MPNNSLTLIRGLPGSGKSTLAQKFRIGEGGVSGRDQHQPVIILETDMFFHDDNNCYKWKKEKLEAAHNWCFETALIMLRSGFNVVVANTFVEGAHLKPYVDAALKVKSLKRIQIVECERLTWPKGGSGNDVVGCHGFPRSKVEVYAAKWCSNDRLKEFFGKNTKITYHTCRW